MLEKKELEHLAELARIELDSKEESRLLEDLWKILDYFKELKEVNTDAVLPMSGGNFTENVFRDEKNYEVLPKELTVKQFPKKKGDFLEVPPVFE